MLSLGKRNISGFGSSPVVASMFQNVRSRNVAVLIK